MHEDQEDVVPRPLVGAVIQPDPKVDREGDAHQPGQPHAEAQHERGGEQRLGKPDDRVEDGDVGQQHVPYQGGVGGQPGVLDQLPRPVLEPAGHRKRQLPQRALQPHRADQRAEQRDGEGAAVALRGVVGPDSGRHRDSADQQGGIERHQEVFRQAQRVMVRGLPDQEQPRIVERIRPHQMLLNAVAAASMRRRAVTVPSASPFSKSLPACCPIVFVTWAKQVTRAQRAIAKA